MRRNAEMQKFKNKNLQMWKSTKYKCTDIHTHKYTNTPNRDTQNTINDIMHKRRDLQNTQDLQIHKIYKYTTHDQYKQ